MDERDRKVHKAIKKRISKFENKEFALEVDEFTKALRIGNGLKPVKIRTVQSYIDVLVQLNKLKPNKRFINYKKNDLIDYFTNREDRGLAQVSINLHKVRLKKYFTWLYHEKKLCNRNEIPDLVSWIQISKRIKKTKSIEDVLTPSQMQSMINATDNLRDKCLLSVGFEGGFRISELLGIRIKDITITPNYAYVLVDGKTGERRNILIESYPHLLKWLENHPFKNNKKHYLFISLAPNYYGNQLYQSTVGSRLKTLAKRVGIKKEKITCHTAFRHSRLTYLASTLNWNEPKLRKFAGWSPTSNMTDVYCHGTEKDVYDALLLEAGIIEDKDTNQNIKEKEAMKPIICPKCNNTNPAGSLYCNCGLCLNFNEAQNIEKKKDTAIEEAMNEFMKIAQDSEKLQRFIAFEKSFLNIKN